MATIPDPKSPLWLDPFDLLREGLPIKKTPALTYLNQCWTKNVEHILSNKEPTGNIPYYWATNKGKGTLITDNALKTTNGTAGKYLYLSKQDAKDIYSEKYHMETAPIFMDRISIKTDIDIKVNGKYSIVSQPDVIITPAKSGKSDKSGKNKKGKNVDNNVDNFDNVSNDSLFLSDISSKNPSGSSALFSGSSSKSPTKGILKSPKNPTPAKKSAKKGVKKGSSTIDSEPSDEEEMKEEKEMEEEKEEEEQEEEEEGSSSKSVKPVKEKPGRGRPRLAKKHKYIREQWAKSRKRKKTKRDYQTKWQRNNNPAPEREYNYNLTPKFAQGEIVSARHPDTHAYHKATIFKQHKDADGNFNRVYTVEWEDKTMSNISQQCIAANNPKIVLGD